GADRHGFLPLKEISSEYFVKPVESGKPNIRDVLKEGQDIVVQIDKEERGNKGAALTTFVSLAGRFIVLKPNKERSGGVSRRIVGDDRDLARQSLNEVDIPKGMSVILRTAGIDRNAEELAWDLETLLKVWQAILDHVLQKPAPFLLYREDNAVIRALRDYMSNEIGEILIDDPATHEQAREFIEQVMPHNLKKLKLYDDAVPLFTRFQIESQIESAFAHSVTLPSGGSIVIDHTEALVSIDINSARATKGGDIEATALNTNVEAADEIARQLRIRDLGGLIVIDFIDMGPSKNQREVENRLRDAVRQDRARVQIGKITRFGLLEMSRQRLRPSIGESAYQTCPRCTGFGTIRSIESLALAILRIVGEEARKERTAKVIAQLPVEVATYLLNEKRDWVQSLETINDTQVILVANSRLETPHYDIRRVRDDQTSLPENSGVSYALAEADPLVDVPATLEERKVAEQAAIDVIKPSTPAPKRAKTGGIMAWLKSLFAGGDGDDKPKKPTRSKAASGSKRGRGASQRGRGRKDQGQQGKRGPAKKKSAQSKSPSRKKTRKKKAKDPDAKSQPQAQDSAAGKDAGEQKKRPSRNRRSRGGRRRRRSAADHGEQQASQNKPQGDKQAADNSKAADQSPARSQTPEKKQSARSEKPAEPVAQDSRTAAPEAAQQSNAPAREAKQDSPKASGPGGPPRARTDAERASDGAKKPESKSSNGGSEPRKAQPEKSKPDVTADDQGGRTDTAQKPAPKPEPRDTTAGKSEGRLLPWDTAATPAEKPAKQADRPSRESTGDQG
ncbi:MAG: Rne/Rng family ribonuclease, partial [Gammaproteobacteria bacterium]|nr:Rne/Rng family ribonuclease [Gammaproteobacteria bacterium]